MENEKIIKKLKEKINDLETYIQVLNHDLRRSLTSIISFSDLLLEGEEDEFSFQERIEFIGIINDTGKKMLKKISNYLLLIRIEEGGEKLEKNPKTILELIKEIKSIFSNFNSLERLEIFLKNPDDDFYNWDSVQKKILLEESLFNSLLVNLIQNAIEASPPKLKILVNIYQEGEEIFCLAISNFGKVPLEVEKRMFKKFVTTKKNGNGLGLHSARLIAQAHGGGLYYQPLPGGTRFIIKIPFQY